MCTKAVHGGTSAAYSPCVAPLCRDASRYYGAADEPIQLAKHRTRQLARPLDGNPCCDGSGSSYGFTQLLGLANVRLSFVVVLLGHEDRGSRAIIGALRESPVNTVYYSALWYVALICTWRSHTLERPSVEECPALRV